MRAVAEHLHKHFNALDDQAFQQVDLPFAMLYTASATAALGGIGTSYLATGAGGIWSAGGLGVYGFGGGLTNIAVGSQVRAALGAPITADTVGNDFALGFTFSIAGSVVAEGLGPLLSSGGYVTEGQAIRSSIAAETKLAGGTFDLGVSGSQYTLRPPTLSGFDGVGGTISTGGAPGKIFYVTPRGEVLEAPAGYAAVTAQNGTGLVLLPEGQALGNNANIIRYGEPGTRYPNGYFRYYNQSGQPINPVTGRPGSQAETHITPSYRGPLNGYPGR